MKKLIQLIAVGVCLSFGVAHAAEGDKKTAQQEKMAACNKDAGDKKLAGDERKKFMSTCLKATPVTQQSKMASCNKEAGEKKLSGDPRKAFMKECLSSKG